MIDASRDFTKDGPKNRLRAQDIHRIIDAFETGRDIPRYARFVKTTEIAEDNEYNLNLPRYIDSRLPEDVQDLEGHMRGGIPEDDIEALAPYWAVCPNLKAALFEPLREGYLALKPKRRDIRQTVNEHAEFKAFTQSLSAHFTHWANHQTPLLKALKQECLPKQIIHDLSENLLDHYEGQPLIDPYDIYQHIMTYWEEVMQDDLYQIADMGWVAETRRIIEVKKNKAGKVTEKDKGWTCDLIPKPLIVARYFPTQLVQLEEMIATRDAAQSKRIELEEEHGNEDGVLSNVTGKTAANSARINLIMDLFGDVYKVEASSYEKLQADLETIKQNIMDLKVSRHFDKMKNAKGTFTQKKVKDRLSEIEVGEEKAVLLRYINFEKDKAAKNKAIKELQKRAEEFVSTERLGDPSEKEFNDLKVVENYLEALAVEATAKSKIKIGEAALDQLAYEKYPELTVDEIKALVVDDKWIATLSDKISGEIRQVAGELTRRVQELGDRYATPLPDMEKTASDYEAKVREHLKTMGLSW